MESVAFVYEETVTEIVEKHERFSFVVPENQESQISEAEILTSLQLSDLRALDQRDTSVACTKNGSDVHALPSGIGLALDP